MANPALFAKVLVGKHAKILPKLTNLLQDIETHYNSKGWYGNNTETCWIILACCTHVWSLSGSLRRGLPRIPADTGTRRCG